MQELQILSVEYSKEVIRIFKSRAQTSRGTFKLPSIITKVKVYTGIKYKVNIHNTYLYTMIYKYNCSRVDFVFLQKKHDLETGKSQRQIALGQLGPTTSKKESTFLYERVCHTHSDTLHSLISLHLRKCGLEDLNRS